MIPPSRSFGGFLGRRLAGGRPRVVVVLLVAALGVLVLDGRAGMRAEAEASLSAQQEAAAGTAAGVEVILRGVVEEVVRGVELASREEVTDRGALLQQVARRVGALGGDAVAAAILTSSGTLLARGGEERIPRELERELGGVAAAAGDLQGLQIMPGLALPGGGVGVAILGHLSREEGEVMAVVLSFQEILARVRGGGAEELGQTLLLDREGTLLFHSRRPEAVGESLVPPVPRGDPELAGILPEILEGEGGSWRLTSETLDPGSMGRGRATLLGAGPVALFGGGEWVLLRLRPFPGGLLPGLPSRVPLSSGALLLAGSLLLLALYLSWQGRGRGGSEEEGILREALMEVGPHGAVLHSQEGGILAANRAFGRMVRREPTELPGLPLTEFLDPAPVAEGEMAKAGVFQGGRVEFRIPGRGGMPVDVEVVTVPFAWRRGEFFLSLVVDVGWRRRVEQETLRVGERERLLVGRELHDGLGQHLTGVALMAKTLARKLVDHGGYGAQEAEEMGRLVKDAVGQIRILSKGLELSEYVEEELPRALEEMGGVARRLTGVDIKLDVDGRLAEGALGLSSSQATQLYRVCHELVSQAARAEMAEEIRITLREREGMFLLSVQQDGGENSRREGPSYRLRYRALLLNAKLEVRDGPDGGRTTLCSFQIQEGDS